MGRIDRLIQKIKYTMCLQKILYFAKIAKEPFLLHILRSIIFHGDDWSALNRKCELGIQTIALHSIPDSNRPFDIILPI